MRSTRTLLLAGATFGLASGSFAADMPVKAPVIPQAVYNWTGVYVGVHAGYGGGMKDWNGINYAVSGALAGVQFGANQQVGNLVFGLEADVSSGMKGSQTENQSSAGVIRTNFTETVVTKIDSIESIAGRLGVAVDRWLVYGKGGLAWAQETHTQNTISTIQNNPNAQTVFVTGSETRMAPMVGLGAEYAFLGHWSVKAEYDYYNFLNSSEGHVDPSGPFTRINGVTTQITNQVAILQRLHVARIGLNYRFGPDRPPAIAPVQPSRSYNWTGFYVGAEGAGGWQHVSCRGSIPSTTTT